MYGPIGPGPASDEFVECGRFDLVRDMHGYVVVGELRRNVPCGKLKWGRCNEMYDARVYMGMAWNRRGRLVVLLRKGILHVLVGGWREGNAR